MEYILYKSVKKSKDNPPIDASSLAKRIINEFRSNEASIATQKNNIENEDELDEEFEKNFEFE